MKTRWLILLLLTAGCGRGSAPAPGSNAAPAGSVTNEPGQSAVGTVVDGLIGKTAVDAGKRARIQLENVRTQENHAISEAMQ